AALPTSELPLTAVAHSDLPATPTAPDTDAQVAVPNPLDLFGILDPQNWAAAVLDTVVETLAGSLVEALRSFVDWSLGLGDSSLNIITQTPPSGTYESETVRSL